MKLTRNQKIISIALLGIILLAVLTALVLEYKALNLNNTSQSSKAFAITTNANNSDGQLNVDYTCDGKGVSPELSWQNAPSNTKSFVIMMKTLPVDGTTKWSWVLYNIPSTTTHIDANNTSVGILGMGSHNSILAYQAPCSQGQGNHIYTVTIYALSSEPQLPADHNSVTGEVLTESIKNITLDTVSIDLNYSRTFSN